MSPKAEPPRPEIEVPSEVQDMLICAAQLLRIAPEEILLLAIKEKYPKQFNPS